MTAISSTRKSPRPSKLKLKTQEEQKAKAEFVNISDDEYQPASPLSPGADKAFSAMLDIKESVRRKPLNPNLLEDPVYTATNMKDAHKKAKRRLQTTFVVQQQPQPVVQQQAQPITVVQAQPVVQPVVQAQPVVQQQDDQQLFPDDDHEEPSQKKKKFMDTIINLVQENIAEVSSMYVTDEPGNLSVNVRFKN